MADGYIYVDDNGAQHGPVTAKQLRALIKAGRIKANNYVRHSNDQHWTLLSDIQIPGVHAGTTAGVSNDRQQTPDQSDGRGLTAVILSVLLWVCAVIGVLCIAAFVTWICLADEQRIKVHDYVSDKAPWLMIEGAGQSGGANNANSDQASASSAMSPSGTSSVLSNSSTTTSGLTSAPGMPAPTSGDRAPIASSAFISNWLIDADNGALYRALLRMRETSKVVYDQCNPQSLAGMSVSQGEALVDKSMDDMCGAFLEFIEAMPDYNSAIKEIMTPSQFNKFKLIYNPFQAVGGSLFMPMTCCDNRSHMLCDDYPDLALSIGNYAQAVISLFENPSLLETLGDS